MTVQNSNMDSQTQTSSDKTQNALPEEILNFLKSLKEQLSQYHGVALKGVYWSPQPKQKVWICSPFRVVGFVKDNKTQSWGRRIQILDPMNEVVEFTLPNGILDGRPRDAIFLMSEKGFRLFDPKSTLDVIQIIQRWSAGGNFITSVDQVGWLSDYETFMLPSGAALSRSGPSTKHVLSLSMNAKLIGNLETWKTGVGTLALGNPNMIFSISLAFSTPLLPLANLQTVLFHLFNKTSQGKTLTLNAALSVWPKIGDKTKTWDATINGLESEISKQNNILFGLDELPKDISTEFGNMIYKAAQGTGKARADRKGEAIQRSSWTTAVLSTGERSMVDTMQNIGKTATGGQGVRMIDLPAVGKFGAFDALHGQTSSREFAIELDRVTSLAYGCAGKEFVSQLIKIDVQVLEKQIRNEVKKTFDYLSDTLSVDPSASEAAEIGRVLKYFALIAVAGELASDYGITGWPPTTATDAVSKVAAQWLEHRGRRPFDEDRAIERMSDYISRLEANFVSLDAAKADPHCIADCSGLYDTEYFYLFQAKVQKLHDQYIQSKNTAENISLKHIFQELNNAKFLEPGGEKGSLQCKISVGEKRVRVYRIKKVILDAFE